MSENTTGRFAVTLEPITVIGFKHMRYDQVPAGTTVEILGNAITITRNGEVIDSDAINKGEQFVCRPIGGNILIIMDQDILKMQTSIKELKPVEETIDIGDIVRLKWPQYVSGWRRTVGIVRYSEVNSSDQLEVIASNKIEVPAATATMTVLVVRCLTCGTVITTTPNAVVLVEKRSTPVELKAADINQVSDFDVPVISEYSSPDAKCVRDDEDDD